MAERVLAMVLRYTYLHRRSLPRVMEIFFWPLMSLFVWGFVTIYIREIAVPGVVVFLIGSIILWEVLYRSQQAISLTITEEFWVRNILNLFIAPVRSAEIVAAACAVGLIKISLTTSLMVALSLAFYDFNLLGLGFWLAPFFANLLLFGTAVGMITMGLIFRYGRAAEALIWGVPFLLQPLSAVFYPLDVLPDWLAPVALALPSTYSFEGMRQVLDTGTFEWLMLARAFGLGLAWLAAASLYFWWMLETVRRRGYLSRQMSE
jgi:ABC-2 type transport system permease protein